MDVASSTEGKMRKEYKMLGSHHKGMRPLWRSSAPERNLISKWALNSSWSEQGSVASSCEHSNKNS